MGREALALAREHDLPILLSVGYSACHWCHVMAHESFEDPATAAVMNRHFVNVKVDREERPDIDQIYQIAHQLVAQRRGGWPLTMFLTPDGKPFFGGTYFPPGPRYNLPGFSTLLERIAELWRTDREALVRQGEAVVAHLGDTRPGPAGTPGLDLARFAGEADAGLRRALVNALDRIDGGFGAAPKFPHPAMLGALLRGSVAAGDEAGFEAVRFTLTRMAEGGIRDHLGGGFCRYSTDTEWRIPHFEKMLYDNGPLLRLYAEAWQLTGDALFAEVCEETAGWLMREMQAPAGGYYSSLDADSEGEEGRFYVWDRDEVERLLPPGSAPVFLHYYGLAGAPNFEGRHWHLHVARPLAEAAATAGVPVHAAADMLAEARAILFAARERRVRPGRDDKILASWNALAIDGMAFAGRVLGRGDWIDSARRAMGFVRRELWRDGRLLATHKDGRSHLNAYLDDHAFLLAAQLELMQCGGLEAGELGFACELADVLLARFEDARDGGFHFTSHDHEALVMRPKTGDDTAMPSGNATAALCLQRLGHLIGEARYLEAARRTLVVFAAQAAQAPHAFGTLAGALAEFAAPPTVVVLTGPAGQTAQWQAALARVYLPHGMVLREDEPASLPPMLAKPVGPAAQAWLCQGPQCLPPMQALDEVLAAVRV